MKYVEEKIGNVPLYYSKGEHVVSYEDKGTEDDLRKLFLSEGDIDKKRLNVLNSNPTWPMLYHLTPLRGNLVKGYEFKKGKKILEVGAGPGGVTEELVKNDNHVTALELSYKRGKINALRNKHMTNLEVVIDNLENYKPTEKYDYVVCVGVLEYAARFINTKEPYQAFMKMLRGKLNKNGILLLAIENRFGLKYWAGAREDHVHTFFAGHNGYPEKVPMRTFGREELKELIVESGFSKTYFYYPFPDYKTPIMLYSDDYYPGHGTEFPLAKLSTPTYDRPREIFFSEQSTMRFLEMNDLFRDFSNSFLVEATV